MTIDPTDIAVDTWDNRRNVGREEIINRIQDAVEKAYRAGASDMQLKAYKLTNDGSILQINIDRL